MDHLIQLTNLMVKGEVVPFIGAGVSVSAGFPTWENHLRDQGITANIDSHRIEALLDQGDYESVLAEEKDKRVRFLFRKCRIFSHARVHLPIQSGDFRII